MKTVSLFIVVVMTAISCAPPTHPLVIGHRGARGHLTENTLPSIAKALDLGVDGIEIDVFRCASGELVVFHDQTLDRLTNTTGYIEQLDLDSIQKIEVKGGYIIPTLEEVLDLIDGKVLLNIELKGAQTAIATNAVLQTYFEAGKWSAEKVIISSFNWKELEDFYSVNQAVPIAVLTEDDPLDAIPTAQLLAAEAINPDYKSLTAEIVDKIHQAKLKVYTWTVNQPEDIATLLRFGVDAIITDYPERVPRN